MICAALRRAYFFLTENARLVLAGAVLGAAPSPHLRRAARRRIRCARAGVGFAATAAATSPRCAARRKAAASLAKTNPQGEGELSRAPNQGASTARSRRGRAGGGGGVAAARRRLSAQLHPGARPLPVGSHVRGRALLHPLPVHGADPLSKRPDRRREVFSPLCARPPPHHKRRTQRHCGPNRSCSKSPPRTHARQADKQRPSRAHAWQALPKRGELVVFRPPAAYFAAKGAEERPGAELLDAS